MDEGLNWSPAGVPPRSAIDGMLVRLEVVDPERHATSLYASSHVPGAEELWRHLAYGPFADQAEFTTWLEQRAASADPLFYAVVDWESMRAVGMAGYRRLEWKCDSLNVPSRRAADRFGFTFEGIFRQHMIVKGRNRDTAWFSMTDAEWPLRKAAFEEWLSPDNFDETGRQRRSLAAVRESIDRGRG